MPSCFELPMLAAFVPSSLCSVQKESGTELRCRLWPHVENIASRWGQKWEWEIENIALVCADGRSICFSCSLYLIYTRFLAEWSSPRLWGSLLLLHAHSSGAGRSPSAGHWLLLKPRDTCTRQHCASSHFTFQIRICVCRSREIYRRGRDTGDSFQEIILKSTELFTWKWNQIQIKEG